jgi:hypothetical protein
VVAERTEPGPDPPGQNEHEGPGGDVEREDAVEVVRAAQGQRRQRSPAEVADQGREHSAHHEGHDIERDRLDALHDTGVDQRDGRHRERHEEDQEDLQDVRLGQCGGIDVTGGRRGEGAAQPPVLNRLPEGLGDPERLVELPLPDRVADDQGAEASDHRGPDLLQGRVQDVAPPDQPDVDEHEPDDDEEDGDRAHGVDERGQYPVGGCLLGELRHRSFSSGGVPGAADPQRGERTSVPPVDRR